MSEDIVNEVLNLAGQGLKKGLKLFKKGVKKMKSNFENPDDLVYPKSFTSLKDVCTYYILKVRVISGHDLIVCDRKSSDPYVQVKFGNRVQRTETIKANLNPVWNDELVFLIKGDEQVIEIQVFDWDKITKDDKMGNVMINLQQLASGMLEDNMYKLQGVKKGALKLGFECGMIPTPIFCHIGGKGSFSQDKCGTGWDSKMNWDECEVKVIVCPDGTCFGANDRPAYSGKEVDESTILYQKYDGKMYGGNGTFTFQFKGMDTFTKSFGKIKGKMKKFTETSLSGSIFGGKKKMMAEFVQIIDKNYNSAHATGHTIKGTNCPVKMYVCSYKKLEKIKKKYNKWMNKSGDKF